MALYNPDSTDANSTCVAAFRDRSAEAPAAKSRMCIYIYIYI